MSKKVFWCKNCLNMSTRPRIEFDNKCWCNACQWSEEKKTFDWEGRKKELKKLLDKYRSNSGNFDCVVPVSGGKDSTWQIVEVLKNNLKPLAFTYKPVLRTKIGQKNLDNLKKLGVDHIEFSVSEKTEQKFLKKAFYKFGAVAIPMHMAMWNISFNLAKKFQIPYIMYGGICPFSGPPLGGTADSS